MFALPEAAPGALAKTPCIRFCDVLTDDAARAVAQELAQGLEYERVELSNVTRQWRAIRPVGDVYHGPMRRQPGWATPIVVDEALAGFESADFVEWLSNVAGEALQFRRPVTAYRMARGDRLCLHDDMSDPDHAVSVAYNCTADWDQTWGGGTRFGEVTGITPLPTPADSPIELQEWHIENERSFPPQFNSMLVMSLDFRFAHGVAEVTGPGSRYALVGIYART